MSGPDLRLRSLEDFATDFRELAEDDRDDKRVVIADVAPRLEADDLRDRLEFEDPFVIATETPATSTEAVEDGYCARFADFQYPDFAFADDLSETDPLADADTQYAGMLMLPTDQVDDQHHRVLDFESVYKRFQQTVDAVNNPEEHAAMTGYFNPAGGEWSICSEGAYYRLQSLAMPKAVSPAGDAMLLRKANMAFAGLVIVPRHLLSESARQLVDGKTTEVTA